MVLVLFASPEISKQNNLKICFKVGDAKMNLLLLGHGFKLQLALCLLLYFFLRSLLMNFSSSQYTHPKMKHFTYNPMKQTAKFVFILLLCFNF